MREEIEPERRLRVAVLMGGSSSERSVSLSTGNMIREALDPARYQVTTLDTQELLCAFPPAAHLPLPATPAKSHIESVTAAPSAAAGRPDVVFIALHGKGGEDGSVQGLLEVMGIPYTGSGVLASALAMDKQMAKRLFRCAGIPVIDDISIRAGHVPEPAALIDQVTTALGFPVFVKPNAEGSTFGCTLVERPEMLCEAVTRALELDPVALVERYVRGMEITVGVLGNCGENPAALPVIEIRPKAAFYDYESKYAAGGSDHIIPAGLSQQQTKEAQQIALRCHELLGCRGMSRTDIIVEGDRLFVLEVNTIPGMTPTSLLPHAAAAAGIPFGQLLDTLIASALAGRER